MRKLVIFTLMVMLCSGMAIYSAGKYSHLKPIIQNLVNSLETFIQDMEKAENAGTIAAALNKYSDAVIKMSPKVQKMMKDYPELEDETNRPEELKPLMDKTDKLFPKLMGLMSKINQYADDPAVKAANERLEKAMKSMDPGQEEEEETEE